MAPHVGVCLGHQAIAHAFGALVVRAPEILHGKTSLIHHDARGLFEGLPEPFEATRYHSLVAEPRSLPPELEVTARTDRGIVMELRHASAPVHGVQFHPESILTAAGPALLSNFVRASRSARAPALPR